MLRAITVRKEAGRTRPVTGGAVDVSGEGSPAPVVRGHISSMAHRPVQGSRPVQSPKPSLSQHHLVGANTRP